MEACTTPKTKREIDYPDSIWERTRDRIKTEAKSDKPNSAQQNPEAKYPQTAKKQ